MTAALLDRLTYRCTIFEINGESKRFPASMRQDGTEATAAGRRFTGTAAEWTRSPGGPGLRADLDLSCLPITRVAACDPTSRIANDAGNIVNGTPRTPTTYCAD